MISNKAPFNQRALAWRELLRDPCGAPLAHPCYAGTESGYLVRTTDLVSLTNSALTGTATVGATVKMDAIYQIQPMNYGTTSGAIAQSMVSGTALGNTVSVGFPSNFVSSDIVSKYRCVAMCAKWVPTGRYSERQGVVGISNISSGVLDVGSQYLIQNILAACQTYAPNGEIAHEVRWLPASLDENFVPAGPSNQNASGVLFAFSGIDGTVTAATTGTYTATLNGYIEISTVWEWLPKARTSLTIASQPPPGYTSQQILASIGDFAKFVYEGVDTTGISRAASQAVAGAAVTWANTYLTRGMRPYGARRTGYHIEL